MSSRFSRYGFTNVTITLFLRLGVECALCATECEIEREREREKKKKIATIAQTIKQAKQWHLFSIMNTIDHFLGAIECVLNARRALLFSLSSLCLIFFARSHPFPVSHFALLADLPLRGFVIAITRMKCKHTNSMCARTSDSERASEREREVEKERKIYAN